MAAIWFPRLMTLAVWALLAWSASFWALQATSVRSGFAPAAPVPPTAASATEPVNVARVFGPGIETGPAEKAAAPAVDHSVRFALQGVVAGRGKAGVALISVEGRPPRPYRVGAKLDDGYLLQSVTSRSATLAPPDNGPAFTVQLPAAGSPPATAAAALPAASLGAVPLSGLRLAPDPAGAQPVRPGIVPVPRGGPLRSASAAAASM